MTAVPVTRTFVAGEVVLASYFNTNINGPINFLLAPPLYMGRQTSTQTLTTGVDTAITQDTEDVDSAGGHSTSTNPSRYTYVYPGWMQWSGKVSFASNATGQRATNFSKNGTLLNGSGVLLTAVNGLSTRLIAVTMPIFGNAGDYVEIVGFQNSGGNLATAVTTVEQPFMAGKWESN